MSEMEIEFAFTIIIILSLIAVPFFIVSMKDIYQKQAARMKINDNSEAAKNMLMEGQCPYCGSMSITKDDQGLDFVCKNCKSEFYLALFGSQVFMR